MDPREKSALRRNHKGLVDEIPMGRDILDHLFTAKLFTDKMMDDIESKPTDADKLNRILKLLPKRGPRAFEKFLAILDSLAPWLADRLRKSVTEPGSGHAYRAHYQIVTCNRPELTDASCSPMPQGDSQTYLKTVDETDGGRQEKYARNKRFQQILKLYPQDEEDEDDDDEEDIEENDNGDTLDTEMLSQSSSRSSSRISNPTMEIQDDSSELSENELKNQVPKDLEKKQLPSHQTNHKSVLPNPALIELSKRFKDLEIAYEKLEAERNNLLANMENQDTYLRNTLREKEKLQNYYSSIENKMQKDFEKLKRTVKEQEATIKELKKENHSLENKMEKMVEDNYKYAAEVKHYKTRDRVDTDKEKQHRAQMMAMEQQLNEVTRNKDDIIDGLQKRIRVLEAKESKAKTKRTSSQKRTTTSTSTRPFGLTARSQKGSVWNK